MFLRGCFSLDTSGSTEQLQFYLVETQRRTSRAASESDRNDGMSVSKARGNVLKRIHDNPLDIP